MTAGNEIWPELTCFRVSPFFQTKINLNKINSEMFSKEKFTLVEMHETRLK